jgi:hypothetical protein
MRQTVVITTLNCDTGDVVMRCATTIARVNGFEYNVARVLQNTQIEITIYSPQDPNLIKKFLLFRETVKRNFSSMPCVVEFREIKDNVAEKEEEPLTEFQQMAGKTISSVDAPEKYGDCLVIHFDDGTYITLCAEYSYAICII